MFRGSGVALVTPFKENGQIDYDALKKLVDFHLENKTDSIIICGTTGEAPTLDIDEHLSCIEACVSYVNHKIPVIAGTGSNNTKTAISNSKEAYKLGVDGLLLVTPYYNKTTQEGLINHYKTIAKNVDIPIILYNVPSRTGVNIEAKTFKTLYDDVDNIIGIKEASGNINQITEIMNLTDQEALIYSGCDEQVIPTLSLGGVGVISVLANIMPKEVHDMVYHYLDGDINLARDEQIKYLKLIKALFNETNPIPVKKALELMHLINGTLREPLIEISPDNLKVLKREMEIQKLL